MIAISVLTLIVLIAGSAFLDLMRLSKHETDVLEMDQGADRAMDEITRALRKAVIPVVTESGASSGFQGVLNSNQGFKDHGKAWRTLLQRGSDCLPFVVPIDADGDGDFLDADFLPELGVETPTGTTLKAATYGSDGKLVAGTGIARDLANLTPGALGLNTGTNDVNPADGRFTSPFVYPATPSVYAVIRFVPLREGGTPVVLAENAPNINYDINEDGDINDSFLLGHMEISYPGGVDQIISNDAILLQINRNEASWEPIFRLIRYKSGDISPNTAGSDDGLTGGEYAIRVRLLLVGNRGRQEPGFLSAKVPLLVRNFETIVKLRNMSMQ